MEDGGGGGSPCPSGSPTGSLISRRGGGTSTSNANSTSASLVVDRRRVLTTAWKNSRSSTNSSSLEGDMMSTTTTATTASTSSFSLSTEEGEGSGDGGGGGTMGGSCLMNERLIIDSLTSKYAECDEDGEDAMSSPNLLGKTLEHLKENIKPGICLICIEDITRTEAVWSCSTCYCLLHLVCIQRWARDSIDNVKEKAAERGFNLPIIFCCPKCREEYPEAQFPERYRCFCGKVMNPTPDAWTAPHSCGEGCGKSLKPECGHVCLLLCHSGPCPPCPKQLSCSCHCGGSPPKTLRCFKKAWSCGKKCGKGLPCSFHPCPSLCHEGECPPCEVPTTLVCKCSTPSEIVVPCARLTSTSFGDEGPLVLSCGKVCGKQLDCGIHKCGKICHEDACGSCERSCPCGKARAPCSGDLEVGKPCEDSCDKFLDCENHQCNQKCHLGSCGSCLIHVVKRCKCGQYEKEVLCSKEFVCATKCRRYRDCKIHLCNKKCCPGDCPPCNQRCGKTLSCKNHKCESICHSGNCYPCPVSAEVRCRCGQTVRHVPCGSEKKCKPPECSLPCTRPSKCDHARPALHKCHFGDCPRCKLPCDKRLVPCGHVCGATCHTTKVKGEVSRPCPKCVQMVNSKCPLHSNVLVQCALVAERCGEVCDKPLPCHEHTCSKPCHQDVAPLCGECTESCSKRRPEGCTHECELGCHKGPCPPCTLVATILCHCEGDSLFYQCFKQHRLSEQEKSCKNQCPKKLVCGHRCLAICHSGPCPEPDRCRRKVKLSCKCRHYKNEVECFLVGEVKTLECVPGVCAIPKTPKETPSSSARKRTRKKKNPEGGEGDTTNNQEDNEEASTEQEERGGGQGRGGGSFFNSNLKAILVIGLSAFVTATVLKYYGSYIIPDEYRRSGGAGGPDFM